VLVGFYLFAMLLTNLLWEILQLPLYSIWKQEGVSQQVFAVAHCTAGEF